MREPGESGARARGDDGTVYFRGGATLAVTRDARFLGVETLYVRWGDWFVALSALLAAAAWAVLRKPYVAPARRESEPRRFER